MSDEGIVLVDYRNGLYQGGFTHQKKSGKGILITDCGKIVICEWQADIPHGHTLIWLDRETYIICEFQKGKLNGNYTYYSPKQTIYTSFKNNGIDGYVVMIDHAIKNANLLEPKGDTSKIIKELACSGLPLSSIVESLTGMGTNLVNLQQFIENQMLGDKTYQSIQVKQGRLYQFNKGSSAEKLGIQIKDEKMIGYGIYIDHELNGLGCLYSQNLKLEGTFRFDLLHGLGLKKNEGDHLQKNVFGYFHNGDIRQIQQVDQLSDKTGPDMFSVKAKYHMRSTNFFNSFVNLSRLFKYTQPEQITKKIEAEKPQQQQRPLAHHPKSTANFRTPAKPPLSTALKTTTSRLSPSPNRFATSKKQPNLPVSTTPTKTHISILQQERQNRLKRDVALVNHPIMETHKHTPMMHIPMMHTPKLAHSPEKELSGAHKVLNQMDIQTMQLQQSIREYQTLTAMIKASKIRRH